MTTIRRVPVAWQTGAGGAGVSVFFSGETDDLTPNLNTFFGAIKALFPTAVSWSVPAAGDKISDINGALAGAWSGGTAATTTGTGGGTYAAGTGAYVRWLTGAVVADRKLLGRTFFCPLISGVYDNDGTITAPNLTILQNAANALQASNKLIIWHRPTNKAAANGDNRLVIGAVVPDRVTSLKSRRS